MTSAVLDASALLALLNQEPGTTAVLEALRSGACMSSVNLSEVVAKLAERGLDEDTIRRALTSFHIDIIDFTSELAYAAGMLRRVTIAAGLSLGDRACLALAKCLGQDAITTDKGWASLPVGVSVRIAR